jgi:hypothetical protein
VIPRRRRVLSRYALSKQDKSGNTEFQIIHLELNPDDFGDPLTVYPAGLLILESSIYPSHY